MFSLILTAVFATALAEPASSQPPVDPATVAEAVRLLDAQEFEEQTLRSSELGLEAGMAGMTEHIQKSFGDRVPDDFLAQLRQVMRDHARTTILAKLPSLKLEAARLYAQEFTRDELVRLRALSADPVMVKARSRSKVLGPRLMMLGIQTMRDAQPELDEKIKRLVTEYLAKRTEKPAS